MKKSRFSESQIINILKHAETGAPVPELCREHGISSSLFYKWRSKYGGTDAYLLREIESATSTTFNFGAIFPFTDVPAYNLPVYASQWPSPDTTQDSVRGCWLSFAAVAISGNYISCACKAQLTLNPVIKSHHWRPRCFISARFISLSPITPFINVSFMFSPACGDIQFRRTRTSSPSPISH